MEIILVKEKETPSTWRFKENRKERPMTIYLSKDQVKELGSPESINHNNSSMIKKGSYPRANTLTDFSAQNTCGYFSTTGRRYRNQTPYAWD